MYLQNFITLCHFLFFPESISGEKLFYRDFFGKYDDDIHKKFASEIFNCYFSCEYDDDIHKKFACENETGNI